MSPYANGCDGNGQRDILIISLANGSYHISVHSVPEVKRCLARLAVRLLCSFMLFKYFVFDVAAIFAHETDAFVLF